VEVTVREKEGPPLYDQQVLLHHPTGGSDIPFSFGEGVRRATTGRDGTCVFDGVPPGSYTVSVPNVVDPALIGPADNPYEPAPIFTIVQDERIPIVVELWRGVTVSAQVLVDRGDIPPGASLVMTSLAGAHQRKLGLGIMGRWSGAVLPGLWNAAFAIPAGYLLTDLEANGEPVPGATVQLDLTEDRRPQALTASLSAHALITGAITADDGACGPAVVATLVEPAGTGLAEATARGGSQFQRVPDQFPRESCVYRLWVPEGTWTVRLEGDAIDSDPREVVVSLHKGETRSLDFAMRKPAKGRALEVRVVSPEGSPVDGALVEVYASGDSKRPVASEKVGKWTRVASFDALTAGSYRVVAGHVDFLDGEERVAAFDPESKDKTTVTVTLKSGARVQALAVNEDGKPVPWVELRVERKDDPPEMRIASEEIRSAKRSRTAISDLTGRQDMKGLYPGTYHVEARMTGEMAGTRFVRIRGDRRTEDAIDVTLSESETRSLALVVLPAASLSGSIACTDGGSFPPQASFRVFDVTARPNPWSDPELREGSALAADHVELGGSSLDRFRIGPLSTGAFALAVRRAGGDYWSFAPGSPEPDHPTLFSLPERDTTNVGRVGVECGPVVMPVPKIASGEALPDLRLGELEVTAKDGGGVTRASAAGNEIHDARMFALGLPEGKRKLDVRFRHPYLVPPDVKSTVEVDLIRGRLVKVDLPFLALGGLLEVRGSGAGVRRSSASGEQVFARAVEEKSSFPGTPAGVYRLESCADPECTRISRTWSSVTVTAGRTLSLP
jgi:hypothetical protein